MQPIATDLSVRALRLLFQILRFIGLLFTGILLIHLFPRLSRRATDRAWSRPATTFGLGLGVFVLVPVAAVVSLFTVILAPAALLALGLWLFGLFAGAVPALAALGRRVSRSRYGIMGSFVVAAFVWRLLRIVPLAGFLIYLLIVIWGMGAWALSLWDGWREASQGGANRRPRRGHPAVVEAGTAHGAAGIGGTSSAIRAERRRAASSQPPASSKSKLPE